MGEYCNVQSKRKASKKKGMFEDSCVFASLLAPSSCTHVYREALNAQELMCIMLQVMRRLVQRVQLCIEANRGAVRCDDATPDPPGDLIGGIGKEEACEELPVLEKRLDEVLLCLKLLRNMCAGVERNQDMVYVECVWARVCA